MSMVVHKDIENVVSVVKNIWLKLGKNERKVCGNTMKKASRSKSVNLAGTSMRKIIIEAVQHSLQRYETCGDWFEDKEGILHIKVSSLSNHRYEYLIAIHELIEALLCHERGIAETDVTRFDEQFEEYRPPLNTDEPGDHPLAPYKKEHFFATNIERLVASELGVDWIKYVETINKL